MPSDVNQQIIDEFRSNHGQVGGPFENMRLLLLTTGRAWTGVRHTTPLNFLPDGERFLVIASGGSAGVDPDWYHNLLADPEVTIETGVYIYRARATELRGEEREALFARAVEADAGWAVYQAEAARILPVIALEPIDGGPAADKLGDALVAIHGSFRRELALIRKEVAESGPRFGTQLRINCLTMCQELHRHHSREDGSVFPALGARHPDLGPALERLSAEHVVIDELLNQLKALLSREEPDREMLLSEVDRLIKELVAHLDYEEERIASLLNAGI